MKAKAKALSKVKNNEMSPGFSGMHPMSVQYIKQQRLNKKVSKMHKA